MTDRQCLLKAAELMVDGIVSSYCCNMLAIILKNEPLADRFSDDMGLVRGHAAFVTDYDEYTPEQRQLTRELALLLYREYLND